MKKRIFYMLVLTLIVSAGTYCQESDTLKPWATSGVFSLNLAQSSFTNWAAGYNYPNTIIKISDLMASGYLLFAPGMDYKPNPQFSAFQ
jgi:hypothetical protein